MILSASGFTYYGMRVGLFSFGLFQGEQTGVVGAQFNGGNTITLGSLPSQSQCFAAENDAYVGTSWPATCSFNWKSSSYESPEIYFDANLQPFYNDQIDVSYSVGNFIAQCSAGNIISNSHSSCTQVNYENYAETKYVGYIVPYTFTVDITVNQNSEPHITLNGFTFVNEINQFVWNNLPSGFQSVNQSAIYAFVSGCVVSGSGGNQVQCSQGGSVNNANVEPEGPNSQVGLYLDQNLQNGLGIACPSNNCQPSGSDPFPTTYMTTKPVYFGITLATFGAYGCGDLDLSTCWPSMQMSVTVDTFLVGTYIQGSTNPNVQYQSPLQGGNNIGSNVLNFLGGIANQLAKGLSNLTSNLIWGAAVVVIVVVAIIAGTVAFVMSRRSGRGQ